MKKIIINGRFLSQNITGVQRVAHELTKELDNLLETKQFSNIEIIILAPKNIIFNNLYRNIKIKKIGILKGHLWEQLELPIYSFLEKGIILNFSGAAPIINSGIICIHDVSFKVNPYFYSKKFVIFYKILTSILVKTSKKILTVSEFSKQEILKSYNLNSEKVIVIYNSWEHILEIKEDLTILNKYELENKEFYLAASSVAPNKNFQYIINLAKLYPNKYFVIVGKKNQKIFGNLEINKMNNLIWCGYVKDEELKALYMTCKGFIFPSFYEGFGLPPLEAMGCGCKEVYVSNTSCLPEIFGNSVIYINPSKVGRIFESNKKIDREKIENILKKYSWNKSSMKILKQI